MNNFSLSRGFLPGRQYQDSIKRREKDMELTPNDIRNFEFPAKVRGYDKEAVDNFREQVALTLEHLKQDNLRLTMEVESVKAQLNGLKQFEDAIKNAAIDARRNADMTISNAKKEAEEILSKARTDVDSQTLDLDKQKSELESQVANILLLRKSYLAKLQGMIQSHLDWVQELTKADVTVPEYDTIAITPMQPPQQQQRSANQSDRLDVTSSSEITTKTRETIATQPSKASVVKTEEANAATRLVTVDQIATPGAPAANQHAIDPDLAAALSNYQSVASSETKAESTRSGKDTAKIEVPTEYQDAPPPADPHLSTGRISTEHYEHATVNIDTPITGGPAPAPQPKDPNSLASVLDNVVHKFEEEMDKAAKS